MATNPKIKHLVYVPFTGVGLIGYRGDEWFHERIQIFLNYTLKSLLAQTNRNFTLWLSFRPEEKENPQVENVAIILKGLGMPYFMTFDGLMYHDDKFGGTLFSKIANTGRIIRRCWRLNLWSEFWPSFKDIFNDKNKTLVERIDRSLEEMPKEWREAEWVYMSRIDSDDMFHKNYIQYMQEYAVVAHISPEKKWAMTPTDGLIYNTTTCEVAEWKPPTNPPFHTIIFPSDVFFDANRYTTHYGDFRSHEDVRRVFTCAELRGPVYCVTTHNPKNHISTIWNHPFRGRVLENPQEILKNFGL